MSIDGKIRNILLPRFDTFGDLVLLQPFIKGLQKLFPEANIYLLVREKYQSIAPLFTNQVQWVTCDINPYSETIDIVLIKSLLQNLSIKPWDLILFTKYEHTWLEYIIASYFKNALRFAISPMEKYPEWILPYLDDLKVDHHFSSCHLVPVEERSHEEDKYKILIDHLGGKEEYLPLPQLAIPEVFQKKSLEILQRFGLQNETFCVCLPGGTENITIKKWPPEKFAKVITWLQQRYQIKTLLIGSETEQEIVEEVVGFVRGKSAVPDIWLGRTGEIPILAGIAKHALFYLGNDSGPMHISAAIGIPVVALFGGGTWPRFLPKGSESHVVMRPMPCYYCQWKCVFGDAPCIKNLPISLVQKALKILLNKDRTDRKDLYAYEGRHYSGGIKTLINKAGVNFRETEADREARLKVIKNLEKRLQISEIDRAKRLEVINELATKLQEIELDRTGRLMVIKDLENRLQEMESNYAKSIETLNDFRKRLEESEEERRFQIEVIRERDHQIEKMRGELEEGLRVIGELERRLREGESEKGVLICQLNDFKKRLEIENTIRLEQTHVINEQRKRLEVYRAELVKLFMIHRDLLIGKES